MSDDLPFFRKLQKHAITAGGVASAKASAAGNLVTGVVENLDERMGITEKVRVAGEKVESAVLAADQQYGISGAARKAKGALTQTKEQLGEVGARVAKVTGLAQGATSASTTYKSYIGDPLAAKYAESGISDVLQATGEGIEQAYGKIRSTIKPYFLPENGAALLQITKAELAYISACIMQIAPGESEKLARQFGTAVTAKLAGVAATGTLLALVGTFGSASTGTSIATLSGAAATNATLAWVGGLAGGGMAAGAMITGGLSIVIGLAAYKMLGSERRAFDALSISEQSIVQACWLLMAAIDELIAGHPQRFGHAIAKELLEKSILPLSASLVTNANVICANLDAKHAIAFRQHVLTDFDRVVIAGFSHLLSQSTTDWVGVAESLHVDYVIGGVFYALLTRSAVSDDPESQMVLFALRRSSSNLAAASESQLSDYLHEFDPDQLKGVAVNVKGIYHEVLWVYQYNEAHTGSFAGIYRETNHPGADVHIRDTSSGDLIAEYQLKATDSSAYVRQHFARYPDIEVLVTEETALRMDGVQSSGINHAEIRDRIDIDLQALADNTLMQRVQDGASYATLAAGGRGLIDMLRGTKAFPQAVAETAQNAGVATAATTIAAFLFS